MAVLFQKKVKNESYEVRNHGKTVRLYKNGVCHSDYNPKNIFNGSVWDLMFVAMFSSEKRNLVQKKGNPAKILVLGIGGGNVIHAINKYAPDSQITAVDIDPVNLHVAKKFFGLNYKNSKLICEDAYSFLKRSREKFDFIIDDIFTEMDGEPMRALPFDQNWYQLIKKNLSKGGTHIVNTADLNEFKSHDIYKKRFWLNDGMKVKYLKAPKCDNAVFVFSSEDISRKTIKKNLEDIGVWPVKLANPFPEFLLKTLI